MNCLIIRSQPINDILAKKKFWEIRGSNTKIRGTIGLIESGSKMIVGCCELVNCLGPLSLKEMQNALKMHRIPDDELEKAMYKKTFAWVLKNAKRFEKPIPLRTSSRSYYLG